MKKIIIIGAGILGATTAYRLAKQGVDVTIVDRQEPGQATDAATGIICPWLTQRRNKAWYHLAKSGAKLYPSLIKELERDGETNTGYAQVGAISIRNNMQKLEEMKDRALKRREDAPEIGEVTLLDPDQTKELFPPIEEGYGSVHISGAARVNGHLIKHALLRAAQSHGASFITGHATLLKHGNQVNGVSVDGKTLHADTVIATAGAWINELLEPLGISFQGSAQRGQLIHLQVPQTETSSWPLIMPPSNQAIVPFDDHIVIGATHEDNVGYDHRITAGGLYDVLGKALTFAPGLADSTVLKTKVGFRPFTPGFMPVIGAIPTYQGLLVANGLGASGLTTGPYLGTQLAALALNEEPEIDLTNYDVTQAIKE